MPLDYSKYPNLRRIQLSIPTELVSAVDVATPSHRSRSAMVTEALQEWLERRGIDPPGDWRGRWTVSGSPGSEPGF
jgi:hypothetical protein